MLRICGTSMRLLRSGRISADERPRRQESIAGTVFDAYVTVSDGMLRPTIRSNSFITAEAMLIVDERDPFCWGM